MRPKNRLCLGFLSLLTIAFAFDSQAAVFTVSTATEFQSALTAAQSNGEDDEIELMPGTYKTSDNGGFPFFYSAVVGENRSLIVRGSDSATTVLDGETNSQILQIDATNSSNPSGDLQLVLQGLSFQNGSNALGFGGAARLNSLDIPILVQDCAFDNNQSLGLIGGLWGDTDSAPVALIHNVFTRNSSIEDWVGGASFGSTSGEVTVSRNIFADNHALGGWSGGAEVYTEKGGRISVTDNVFYQNTAFYNGGGMTVFAQGNEDVFIVNNTFFQNQAEFNGGGIFLEVNGDGSSLNIYNNILYDNTAGMEGDDIFLDDDYDGNGSGPAVNLVTNDYTGLVSACQQDPVCAASRTFNAVENFNVEPRMIDPAGGNFYLAADSPLLGRGTPSAPDIPAVDLAGNPRVVNGAVDLGAFQTQQEPAPSPTATPIPTPGSLLNGGACSLHPGSPSAGLQALAWPILFATAAGLVARRRGFTTPRP